MAESRAPLAPLIVTGDAGSLQRWMSVAVTSLLVGPLLLHLAEVLIRVSLRSLALLASCAQTQTPPGISSCPKQRSCDCHYFLCLEQCQARSRTLKKCLSCQYGTTIYTVLQAKKLEFLVERSASTVCSQQVVAFGLLEMSQIFIFPLLCQ